MTSKPPGLACLDESDSPAFAGNIAAQGILRTFAGLHRAGFQILQDGRLHRCLGKPVLTLWLLAVSGLLCLGAKPYEPVYGDPLLEPWRWHTFQELNGLGAHCMIETTSGEIWFGTARGTWSFDGINWVHHDPDELYIGGVLTLQCGLDGTLYAGGRSGISHYRDGRWSKIFPYLSRPFGDLKQLLAARDGSLWAATSWGAVHFANSNWTLHTGPQIGLDPRVRRNHPQMEIKLLPESLLTRSNSASPPSRRHNIYTIAEDREGRIWLGTEEGEILCFNPASGQWSMYNETDGIIRGRTPAILPLQDGSVWVAYGAGSGFLNVFDGVSWKATRLADFGMPAEIGDMIQTRDGVIWLSGRYVLCANRNGQWRRYEKPDVPIPTARNLIMQTSDGALWIAGSSTEIQRVDYQTRRWLTIEDLNFQWESPTGTEWFLHRDGRVVSHQGTNWISYGSADGLMDTPVALLGTKSGDLWAAGSHQGTASTARFDGTQWTRFVHDEFSWGVEWRGVLEASDGSVWFSAAVDSSGPPAHRDGILQYRNGKWIHHHQPGRVPSSSDGTNLVTLLPATQRPEPVGKFLCLGESRDGRIWAGRNILAVHDGSRWDVYPPFRDLDMGIIETLYTTREGDLWMGTRQSGAARFDGKRWQSFQGKGSLAANSVRSIVQTSDGSIWAATDRNVCRFDGHTWSADMLPSQLNILHEGGSLKAAPSGGLWINHFAPEWTRRGWPKYPMENSNCLFRTVRHQFRGSPPETTIKSGSEVVSQPGNLSIFWSGAAPWRQAKDAQLQFSFRMDDRPWSPFTSDSGRSFFTLSSGPHRFEVRARDVDFNVDPTPASLNFVVLPPVWKQSWFIILMITLTSLLITQSVRVFLDRSHLRRANRALAAEVEERERAEAALQRLNLELDQRVKSRTTELEAANKELEAFSYSVSHDLRAPLRSIDGFSRGLMEDYAEKLDESGKEDLKAVRSASQRMGQLIDDMLMLAKVTRSELHCAPVDLSALAQLVAADLKKAEPERNVELVIAPGLIARTDARLMRIALENLLGNAWKFTGKNPSARIEFGSATQDGVATFFVRDNGVGFDMTYSQKLFGAFQRLHSVTEFPGTGIGLATVQRIIHRHGGRVWAQSTPGQGATFYFILPS